MTWHGEAYNYEPGASDYVQELYGDERSSAQWRPTRPIFVQGGLTSAILNTPKGQATLNLPVAAATLSQFRALEQVLNSTNGRLDSLQADVSRLRAELALRRRDQQAQGGTASLFPLLMYRELREDLEGHRHSDDGDAELPDGDSTFSSLLPLLLLQPGLSGGSSGAQDGAMGLSPLLLLLFLGR
jgi:hypothetical protein